MKMRQWGEGREMAGKLFEEGKRLEINGMKMQNWEPKWVESHKRRVKIRWRIQNEGLALS